MMTAPLIYHAPVINVFGDSRTILRALAASSCRFSHFSLPMGRDMSHDASREHPLAHSLGARWNPPTIDRLAQIEEKRLASIREKQGVGVADSDARSPPG